MGEAAAAAVDDRNAAADDGDDEVAVVAETDAHDGAPWASRVWVAVVAELNTKRDPDILSRYHTVPPIQRYFVEAADELRLPNAVAAAEGDRNRQTSLPPLLY